MSVIGTIFRVQSTAIFTIYLWCGCGAAFAQFQPPPYVLAPTYDDATLSASLSFPTTGTITASEIGNGVWWRPELNETSITLMLQNLNEWEIDNLYVDVFRSGETLFPSEILPQNPAAIGRDWFQYIIDEARSHDIRVHAWAQVLCWHESNSIAASTHPLLLTNPHWLQSTSDGQVADGKSAARFVSPGSPEVQSILQRLAGEICHYPIDGLNLDAIHYNDRFDAGYSDHNISEFQGIEGIDPLEIERDMDENSDWMKWVAYREDQLTSVVQLISDECRKAGQISGRRILVSVAVEPAYEESRGRNRRYQHWGQWIESDFIDATMPQCFNPDLPGLERQLWEARSVHMGSDVACVPGLYLDDTINGRHPALPEQRRILRNTGFQYCTVMDYEGLLQAKTTPEQGSEKNQSGFWSFFSSDDEDQQ